MKKTVAEKMSIKEGAQAIFIHAPSEAVKAISLPSINIADRLDGEFDYIHFFTKTQADFNDTFPKLKTHLKPDGNLWVSWPKNRQLGTDLTLPKVIELGYNHGLVESICLSIDTVWSALKFTHPKKNKAYRNSYGKLKVFLTQLPW